MYLDVAGHRIFTAAFGPGPRTFLGHSGWIGTWEDWMPVLEELSKTWRAVAYDHRGAGETAARPEEVTVDALVDEILGVMDGLGVERCTLGGFSSGTPIALLAVLRQPERFDGLVILSGKAHFLEDPGDREYLDTYLDHYDQHIDAAVVAFTPEPDVAHFRRWAGHILRRADPIMAVRHQECRLGLDLRPQLMKIAVPTLIIHGSADVIPLAEAEYLAAHIPDSRLVVMQGSGHLPGMIRGAEVGQAIDAFFNR
jgi:pimeloyl-ACP methyl ester carboxylesterase